MAKKKGKSSKKSKGSTKEASAKKHDIKPVETYTTTNIWQITTVVLGILLVISVFTGGFGIGGDSDSASTNSGESFWQTLFGPRDTDSGQDTMTDAEIVIVEYSDFQCPFCARAYPTVNQILEEYGDKVEFVYKHFPLSNHPLAPKAAEASECARDQGMFKEYHDKLFDTQQLEVTSLKKHAADLGLDTAEFNECLDSGEKADLVAADFREGQQKGVRGTPTFFINDYPVVGAQPYANFKAVIDKALAGEELVVEEPEPAPTQEVVKADKPTVELFVMSHCPYGTQMEKGILPVVSLLEEDIEFDLNFVYYAMHGETEVYEQLRQYCIQRDQEELLISYLICFLEEGDTEGCLDTVGVDRDMLDSCVAEADEEFDVTANLEDEASYLSGRFPLFNTDKVSNDEYGVRGSPTLVINGQVVSTARDSATLLDTICTRFNEQPEACSTEFSSTNPSPGFGFGESDTNNNIIGGCVI